MPATDYPTRPAQVVYAVRMFYLVVAIGVVRTLMTVLRHADVRSPYFLVATKFVVYAVALFLIYKLAAGSNWARWLLVVLLAIGIPLTVLPTIAAFSSVPLHSLLGFLQLGLYLVALYFLFQKTSSDWYRSR